MLCRLSRAHWRAPASRARAVLRRPWRRGTWRDRAWGDGAAHKARSDAAAVPFLSGRLGLLSNAEVLREVYLASSAQEVLGPSMRSLIKGLWRTRGEQLGAAGQVSLARGERAL